MKRRIITTSDGSKTIQIEDWNEQYHSIHGAIQEAEHVFIKHGLHFFCNAGNSSYGSQDHQNAFVEVVDHNKLSILELGFGTGLNAFLTLIEAEKLKQPIHYMGIEAYPVRNAELEQLNYASLISANHERIFHELHKVPWEENHQISSYFQLAKQKKLFKDIKTKDQYDIIYFDAFGPRVQPELWTEAMFKLMFDVLRENGILVTYSAKGSVRRAMQSVGFDVERLPGPPGKREMLRAHKGS
ncbi:tRNA (5-methylaminomethyl-2-thiouridine)(34)-methyltransferase MnmD [Winogradskyella aurantia]|uniref:SAM-dependent methyltransferase n=1 Tax=Winogradskyella aurantia TaxID=1915063 RepID=A0A265URP3_9FLAO|nr:tRNA (5-methylaminomethyl-2-thiouridine)(34)-methyltransferase MnmD [Winogradskyella aurantia]OZV67976.1 SAM-dependent methyltransferase [Winogradskyella aurantia]